MWLSRKCHTITKSTKIIVKFQKNIITLQENGVAAVKSMTHDPFNEITKLGHLLTSLLSKLRGRPS